MPRNPSFLRELADTSAVVDNAIVSGPETAALWGAAAMAKLAFNDFLKKHSTAHMRVRPIP
jgi:hypothetical protein